MSTIEAHDGVRTHDVINQPKPLVDYNVFEGDRTLVEAVKREGADWATDRISAVGAYAGSAHAVELGRLANDNPPKLRTHDRYGNRVDEVEFHPAWHELLGASVEHELHSEGGVTFFEALAPVPLDHVPDRERDLVLGPDGGATHVER